MAKYKPLKVNPGIKGNVGLAVANVLVDLAALFAANKEIFFIVESRIVVQPSYLT
jgi:hypothetical protein